MNHIGLQFWSIQEAAREDLLGTIEKIADMGYTGAQFAGFGNHKAEDVKAKLDEVGMKVAGAHVQLEQLENELEETLAFHQTIGNDLIIVPYLDEKRRTSKGDYEKVAEILSDLANKLHAQGFKLAYHNHDFEFDLFDGKTGFEIIFDHENADHLKMELDCFWVAYAGYDPVELIDKYAGKVVSLHIKDKKVTDGKPISTELGTGTLPLVDYVQKGQSHQVDWFIVEQENFTKDPMDSAKENAKTLQAIVGKHI